MRHIFNIQFAVKCDLYLSAAIGAFCPNSKRQFLFC